MKKKLLFFVAQDAGLISHRLALARSALEQGYDVYVMCQLGRYKTVLQKEGFHLLPLSHMHRGGTNVGQDLLLIQEIWRHYRIIKPDIVHQVALKPVIYGTLVARLLGIGKIINALGGLGYVFTSQNLKAKLLNPVIRFLFKSILGGKHQTLIVQNEDDKGIMKALIPQLSMVLIPGSGVDVATFCPPLKKTKRTPRVITTVCRLLWDKGVGDLIKAAQLLNQEGVPFVLNVVGDPDPQNPACIDEITLAQWHKIPNIRFWGILREPEVLKLYQQSDIALLASYREGMPKALLEALAVGLPIITTDVAGCRDVLTPGVEGLLVPVRDPKALAQAMKTLLAMPENKFTKMGKASRQRAVSHFEINHINDQILALYQDKPGHAQTTASK